MVRGIARSIGTFFPPRQHFSTPRAASSSCRPHALRNSSDGAAPLRLAGRDAGARRMRAAKASRGREESRKRGRACAVAWPHRARRPPARLLRYGYCCCVTASRRRAGVAGAVPEKLPPAGMPRDLGLARRPVRPARVGLLTRRCRRRSGRRSARCAPPPPPRCAACAWRLPLAAASERHAPPRSALRCVAARVPFAPPLRRAGSPRGPPRPTLSPAPRLYHTRRRPRRRRRSASSCARLSTRRWARRALKSWRLRPRRAPPCLAPCRCPRAAACTACCARRT
jgi:hypothetical protein